MGQLVRATGAATSEVVGSGLIIGDIVGGDGILTGNTIAAEVGDNVRTNGRVLVSTGPTGLRWADDTAGEIIELGVAAQDVDPGHLFTQNGLLYQLEANGVSFSGTEITDLATIGNIVGPLTGHTVRQGAVVPKPTGETGDVFTGLPSGYTVGDWFVVTSAPPVLNLLTQPDPAEANEFQWVPIGEASLQINPSNLAVPMNSGGVFVDSNVRQTGVGGAAAIHFTSAFGNSTHGVFQANPENGVIGLELGTIANPRGLAITGRTELKTVATTTQDITTNVTVATIDSGGVIGSTSLSTAAGGTLTAAEIKSEYESNDDTNAFTDADEVIVDGWGTPPTGTKQTNLSWNELVTPVVHDSVSGEFERGQVLGAGFSHPAADAALSLLFTLPDGDDRDVARDEFFIPRIRAIGMVNNIGSARVIDRVVDVGTNQLNVFFEEPITVAASDSLTANIEVYTVEVDNIHTIEGGDYQDGVLNITNDVVNIKPLWDGGQFVQTLLSTETDVADRVTLIEKRVISGNNETHRTLYGFPGATALTLYSDTARANSVLTQNYTG